MIEFWRYSCDYCFKNMNILKIIISFILVGFVYACMKEVKPLPKNAAATNTGYPNDPFDFGWGNSKTIKINIGVTNDSKQNNLHVIAIYNAHPKLGGQLITKGSAKLNQEFVSEISIANTYKTLFVEDILPDGTIYYKEISIDHSLLNISFSNKLIQKTTGLGKTDGNINPPIIDSDNDLVPDSVDDYPNDANKAYNNYYPFQNQYATLAFEDLWPCLGDYDMNDVVMNYKYNIVTNATNKVVQVIGNYTLQATGGSYQNGFGISFPLNRNQITDLSGAILETNQNKAVAILFTNMRQEMKSYNTIQSQAFCDTVNYVLNMNVSNGPLLSEFGLSAYNPFIWNNSEGFGRGFEVHLPNHAPTDLANTQLFGNYQDNSNSVANRYYVSKSNELPWALNIPVKFDYPTERNIIHTAYLKFIPWVQSGGTLYNDWYLNINGYRDVSKIYVRP